MRMLPLLSLVPLAPMVVAGCGGGTASIDVTAATASALALSVEEAAAEDVSARRQAAAEDGTEPASPALVLHVLRTEAKVVTSGDDEDAESDDADAEGGDAAAAEDTGTSSDPSAADDAAGASDDEEAPDAAADESAEDEADAADGWTVVSEEARDVDLLALVDSPEEIAAGELPAGKLTQIRLVLDPDNGAELVVDGLATPVQVPSGSQSGFKVLFAPPVELGDAEAASVALEVDGDLSRGNGPLMLRPTLRVSGVTRRGAADNADSDNAEPSDG